MWPFKPKPKANPTDKLIEEYEKLQGRLEKLRQIMGEAKPRKTQAELVAEALQKYDDSMKAIEDAPHVEDNIRQFALQGVRSAYYRDLAASTR